MKKKLSKTQPVTKKVKKKITNSKVKKMDEQFIPTSGFCYIKEVEKKRDELVISYNLKGDSKILTFMNNRMFDAMCMISDDLNFELVKFKDSNESITIIDNKSKYPNFKNDFANFIMQPPMISLNRVLDNVLRLSISFDKTNIDFIDAHIIYVVEYLLSAVLENVDTLLSIINKTEMVFNSDSYLEDLLSEDDINEFSLRRIFIKKSDLERGSNES